jgi:hypothetical protein
VPRGGDGAVSALAEHPNLRFRAGHATLKDQIRERAQEVAREAGLEVEYIVRKDFRKEDRIAAILKERGEHPGLVHIFSALEPCTSFQPWHDKPTGRTLLKPDSGECLHYYVAETRSPNRRSGARCSGSHPARESSLPSSRRPPRHRPRNA